MLMWSHYADYHKGICVEYTEDIVPFKNNIYLGKVNYHGDGNEEVTIIGDLKKGMIGYMQRETLRTFLRKTPCWEYEHEWRIIYENKNFLKESIDGMNLNVKKPINIFMGTRISNEDKEFITKFCKERGIGLFQMKLDIERYDFGDPIKII